MDEERPGGHRRQTRTALGAVLSVVLLVGVLLLTHRPGGWLPDLPELPGLPGLPDRPEWLRPVLKWGKLLVLAGIGLLAVIGEIERRRKREQRDDSAPRDGS